ncbi:hypothetical protein AVEN_163141-1 [Araneus ventricosus]|uniref:Uncharacterized protein n=1 Tax=Araneus ventricosus TaxID=182803 RepID=A0A4Y2DJB8_ARAVE|nr:hypothetical protein AVEN_163141-1 [Araneus ventricosus]
MPGDEVMGDSFQPFLFEVWRWLPHMPRHCESTLRGIVKCRVSSTTTCIDRCPQRGETFSDEGNLNQSGRLILCVGEMASWQDEMQMSRKKVREAATGFTLTGLFSYPGWVGSVSPFDRGTLIAFSRPKEGV